MIVVLSATLTTLDSFQSNAETNSARTTPRTRRATPIDQLARDLRNLASPTNEHPEPRSSWGAGPRRPVGRQARAGRQPQPAQHAVRPLLLRRRRPTPHASAADLDERGPTRRPAATGLSRHAAGAIERPIAETSSTASARCSPTTTPSSQRDHRDQHERSGSTSTPARRRRDDALRRRSSCATRTAPTARFTAPRDGISIVLNGSDSEDPEERALYYEWYDAAARRRLVGEGIVNVYTPKTPGTARTT